jgi:hypothetical protein
MISSVLVILSVRCVLAAGAGLDERLDAPSARLHAGAGSTTPCVGTTATRPTLGGEGSTLVAVVRGRATMLTMLGCGGSRPTGTSRIAALGPRDCGKSTRELRGWRLERIATVSAFRTGILASRSHLAVGGGSYDRDSPRVDF